VASKVIFENIFSALLLIVAVVLLFMGFYPKAKSKKTNISFRIFGIIASLGFAYFTFFS